MRPRYPLTFLAALLMAPATCGADPIDEQAWAEEVVLRGRFLANPDPDETGTRRWAKTPAVSARGGTKEQQKAVAEVVEHLNDVLKETPLKGVRLLKPNDPTATLAVVITTRASIPAQAAKFGFRPEALKVIAKGKPPAHGCYWPAAASKWEIGHALVLVSGDKGDAEQFRRNVLWHLAWDLGFMSDGSPRDKESVFYADGDKSSTADRLTARDKRLLVWYYTHVPAGTKDLTKLFKDHWPKDE